MTSGGEAEPHKGERPTSGSEEEGMEELHPGLHPTEYFARVKRNNVRLGLEPIGESTAKIAKKEILF